jgi:hypothetical protein
MIAAPRLATRYAARLMVARLAWSASSSIGSTRSARRDPPSPTFGDGSRRV